MKLKGFTQLLGENDLDINKDEAHGVYAFYDDPNFDVAYAVKTKDDLEPGYSGWTKDKIPGRDHDAFSSFYIWFEYE